MNEFSYRSLIIDDAKALQALRLSVVAVSPIGMGARLEEVQAQPFEGIRRSYALMAGNTISNT